TGGSNHAGPGWPKPRLLGHEDSNGGGTSGVDRCQQAFSTLLEEVAQCDYFTQARAVPAAGELLSIAFDRRIFAIDARGVKVGALPTSFNYLAACMQDGVTYAGIVKSSALAPVPTVEADFVPE
ncbi:hypothetical protein, partial [Ralstonia pseudosolanacearum]|uniref:hypothetical protein n=1 Tax=Ralstonia pseudosolanacearum TaxID=1310165 RepID=UPI002676037B